MRLSSRSVCCAGSSGRLAAACGGRDLDVPVVGHVSTTRRRRRRRSRSRASPARISCWRGRRTARTIRPTRPQSTGSVSFQETNFGLVNTDWTSTPPPTNFPVLCASLGSCGNSLASTYYNVIWGARAPVLRRAAPARAELECDGRRAERCHELERLCRHRVDHRAGVPNASTGCKDSSQITQAGALGDPYGSGVRTTWWVYGVGPVKVVFQHSGGSGAPVTAAELQSTNQTADGAAARPGVLPDEGGAEGHVQLDEPALLQVDCRLQESQLLTRRFQVEAGNREILDRPGCERNGDREVLERFRADEGRRRVPVHDAARRHYERLERNKSRVACEAAAARADCAARDETPPFLHAVRPDDVRVQPVAAGVSRSPATPGRPTRRAATSPSMA